jgi:D-3-phosphoglycerate dehydrogenase
MSISVLIIDKMHSSINTLLEEAGIIPDYRPKATRAEVLEILPQYEGLIVRSKLQLDKEMIDRATQLKFIARAGSGLDIIDVEYAESKHIQVFNAPEGNRDAVAEHTIGLILSILHRIPKSNQEVKNFIWQREANRGSELKNKTIAVIGYGNVGQELVKRLQSFSCKVLVYDKYKSGFAHLNELTKEADMEEIFEKSDLVTFHIPLTDETQHMVNLEYLQKFKKPIILLNTARGELINLQDLCIALEKGLVIGAGLDVIENEKLETLTPTQKETLTFLAAQENVILTPHIAGWTHESYVRINEVLVKKICQVLSDFSLK